MLSSNLTFHFVLSPCPVHPGATVLCSQDPTLPTCFQSFFINDLRMEKGSHVGRKPVVTPDSPISSRDDALSFLQGLILVCLSPEQPGWAVCTEVALTRSSPCDMGQPPSQLPPILILRQGSSFLMLDKGTVTSEESNACPALSGGTALEGL